jgi:hypothetical protein
LRRWADADVVAGAVDAGHADELVAEVERRDLELEAAVRGLTEHFAEVLNHPGH